MTYYADFVPFAIRDHNEEVLREVRKLRLEKRLREDRRPRPSWRFRPRFQEDAAVAALSESSRVVCRTGSVRR